MRTQEAIELEDLSFEEAPDLMTAMTLAELCRYVDDARDEDAEIGLRKLLEHPEALSSSFRRQLH